MKLLFEEIYRDVSLRVGTIAAQRAASPRDFHLVSVAAPDIPLIRDMAVEAMAFLALKAGEKWIDCSVSDDALEILPTAAADSSTLQALIRSFITARVINEWLKHTSIECADSGTARESGLLDQIILTLRNYGPPEPRPLNPW